MIIYLDEAGDIGPNFENQKTSRYLVIGLLVFPESIAGAAHIRMVKAVKRILKNKLHKNTVELKGNKLLISIKKYFLKEMNKQADWPYMWLLLIKKVGYLIYHLKPLKFIFHKALGNCIQSAYRQCGAGFDECV